MATQKQIAAHLGLSERRVRDVLILLKLPTRGADIDEVRLAYLAHLRSLAAGHGAPGDELDLAHERAALAKVQREQIEQNMRVRRRELIERRPAERTMAITGGRIRDGLIVIADRLGPVVAAETNPDRVRELMIEEIEQTLGNLADAGKALAEDAEREAAKESEHG